MLLPMLITLPLLGSMITPKGAVDVEVVPAEAHTEQTSALPVSPRSSEENAAVETAPTEMAPPAKSKAKVSSGKPAKAWSSVRAQHPRCIAPPRPRLPR